MEDSASIFIPNIYKNSTRIRSEKINVISDDNKFIENNNKFVEIDAYISSRVEKLLKPHFEIFENEDIKLNILPLIHELQDSVDKCVKKSGDTINNLCVLKQPTTNLDVPNKEYLDVLFSKITSDLSLKISKNSDIDLGHYRIKNSSTPKDLYDLANKNYVDNKFEQIIDYIKPVYHIFSKGQCISKKTFFFNPGFITPHQINIVSVGFSVSPYKFKIGEKLKMGEINPLKLYFMINNEIKSEYTIEKDIQLGYILKEFDTPITIEKGENLIMLVEASIEDASVNIAFY